VREPRVRDVRGLSRTERGGAVEKAERIRLRTGREKRDAELVHHVGLLWRQVQCPTKGARGRDEVLSLARDQAQAEVRLPELGVEREDALEGRPHVIESCGIDREGGTPGTLELGLEVRPL
jgi:hypothetical protein